MKSIETFSKYLNDLAREKKYENILVNFKNNSSDFSKEEIKSNIYIVRNVIDAHRHEKLYGAALEFISEYEIEMGAAQNKIVISSFLWLLIFQLDEEVSKENSANITKLLDKINSIIEFLDLSIDYYDMPIVFLLKKTTGIKKISAQTALKEVIRLLKSAKIKMNERLKEAIKRDSYASSSIASVFGKAGHPDRGFKFLKYVGVNPFEEGTS